jgi:hypothetical protein
MGGGINFRFYNTNSADISAGQNSNYSIIDYDSQIPASYDNTTFIYTVPSDGTYLFTFGWFSSVDNTATVNLIRNRDNVKLIIQQSTQGSTSTTNNSFVSTTLTECL